VSDTLTVSPLLLAPLGLFALLLLCLAFFGKVPVGYNVRNLVVRWKITLLTALAFTVIVGLLVVMLAFVNGMNRLTKGAGQPDNVFVLQDGMTDEAMSNLGFGEIKEIELQAGVERDAAGKPLASWEIYAVGNQPVANPQAGAGKRRFVPVRGIDEPVRSAEVHRLSLHDGGAWFSQAGVQELPDGGSAVQAVLGEGLAKEFGRDQGKASLEPGDRFSLGGRDWIVTGLMHSAGSIFDTEVWAKRDLVGSIFGKTAYTTVVLRARDAAAARELATDLSANYKKPAVRAQPEQEYFASQNATTVQFLIAIVFMTVIVALGGVVGVMNTMFAAISQRTKDIAVLRVIGYARWQVLVSFLLETLLLALLGGLIGCAVGILVHGRSVTSIISSGQGGGKTVILKMVVDMTVLTTGLLLALVMGLLGGLLPSLSAMRLRPLESLR
jgi:ABC-type antimicrobial peptide transport system permease subunit